MRKILVLFIVIMTFSSCHIPKNDITNFKEDDTLKIGVFFYRDDDYFIHSVKENMEKTIRKNAINWENVKFDFFDGKNQNEIQMNQIREAVKRDYDVLAVNIVERSSATKIIDIAKKAGIPILFFNRQPLDVDMARWDKLYYVGLDGVQSGEMQGEIIIDYWNNHPEMDKNGDGVLQYVMLQGQYNHQDTILRTKYSIETVTGAGIKVEELAKETANWQRLEADAKMEDLLNIYGNRVELIISNNDMMALGALDAINRKKHKKIPIVGVDGVRPALEALKKGDVIGTVVNDEKKQGEVIAQISVTIANGIDPTTVFENMESGTYYWIDYEKISVD